MRSMLIRVRNQEKCDGTSALTSNLPVSVTLFAISHQTYLYFFPNLASPSRSLSLQGQDMLSRLFGVAQGMLCGRKFFSVFSHQVR